MISTFLYILSGFLAFSILIIIHEFGHFIVAKAVGMKVNEFSLGMGPKIYGVQKGETLYSLRAFPIGGFIRPEGEDTESEDPRAFGNRPLWARAAVVAAGPISNFIVAFLLVLSLLTFYGRPTVKTEAFTTGVPSSLGLQPGDAITKIDGKQIFFFQELLNATSNAPNGLNLTVLRNQKDVQVAVHPVYSKVLNQNVTSLQPNVIGSLKQDMPAAKSGLKEGDIIKRVNGNDIYVFEELIALVNGSQGKDVALDVIRDGQPHTITVPTKYDKEQNRYMIGIYPKLTYSTDVIKSTYIENFKLAPTYSMSILRIMGEGLKKLFTGNVSKEEVAGPVGILRITVEVAKTGLIPYINLIALLSLNLGIFNLLPIPALDGGRLLFFGIEALRGKPIDQKKEALVHFIGFALLITLVIFITFNDIKNLFS